MLAPSRSKGEGTNSMAGEPAGTSGADASDRSGGGFLAQIRGMIAALRTSHQRKTILFLCGALIVVVGATAYAQVLLNAWNRPFYDSLAREDWSEFVTQLIVFAGLAGLLLA